MKKSTKILIIVIAVFVLSYPLLAVLFLKFFVFPTRTIQILRSPDYKHKVVLRRMDGIDLVFFVKVDGQKVYSSPDFAPNRKVDFRERLVWDKTGAVVVLEVMGRRLFGFDVKGQRPLSDLELLSVEYAPEPNQWEYGFEGTWPQDRLRKKEELINNH